MNDDREYCQRRAAQELAAAENASSRIVANIHRELAEQFLARAGGDAAPTDASVQAAAAQ
jgi:hypothetical protein